MVKLGLNLIQKESTVLLDVFKKVVFAPLTVGVFLVALVPTTTSAWTHSMDVLMVCVQFQPFQLVCMTQMAHKI